MFNNPRLPSWKKKGDADGTRTNAIWDNTVNIGSPLQDNIPGHPVPVGRSNGQDEELTVMRILWDLYDANNSADNVEDLGLDTIALGFNGVLDKIRGLPLPPPAGVQTAYLLNDLWRNLTIGKSLAEQLNVGAIFQINNVSPQTTMGGADTGMFVNGISDDVWREDSDPLPEFRFRIPDSDTAGFQRLLDTFTIRFFDNALTEELFSVAIPLPANGNIVVWQPTAEQWNLIKAGGGFKKWFVGGRLAATDSALYWSTALTFDVLLDPGNPNP